MLKCIVATLLLALPRIAFAQLSGDDLVVSEVFPNPSGGTRGQFIELFNPTGGELNLYGYQLCDFDKNFCTALKGTLAASGYYTLCRDISQYPFCNIGTSIPLHELSGVFLIGPTESVIDFAEWTSPAPVDQSYARGLLVNLLVFTWTTPTNGDGFLGTAATPAPVAPTPPPVAPIPVTPQPIEVLPVAPPTVAPTMPPSPPPTLMPVTPAPVKTPAPVTPAPTTLCSNAFCHPRADCDQSSGVAICTCKQGFAGDGQFVCNDIDECSADPDPCLGTGTFCVNEFGSFKCGCGNGFTDVNGVCFDINECSDANACGANALCTNTDGDFVCSCDAGFSGDPKVGCTDTDECDTIPGPCDANADCTNSAGGFTCTCNDGFEGNGFTCGLVDNCSTNPCHPQATCTNSAGGATCACNPGFAGNGVTSCVQTPTPAPVFAPSNPPITISPAPTFISQTPSIYPTDSNSPSFSNAPSLTKMPSQQPSNSNVPSFTETPSVKPSISLMPSITDMPSNVPSRSDMPT